MSFDNLVADLGQHLDIELIPDGNGACQLLIDESIAIQLEPDATGEHLLVASPIFELPPGKFREDVLHKALIANAIQPPSLPTLAFIEKSSILVLFNHLSIKALSTETLTTFLSHFLSLAVEWKEALDSGQPAPVKTFMTKDKQIDLN